MRFTALLAALALALGCGVEPDPPSRPAIEMVSTVPFHSMTHAELFELKVVDAGTTFMQRLVEHVALDRDRRDITGETEQWSIPGRAAGVDFYLTAASPHTIQRYVASDPSLTLPPDRELAFGQLDDGRWRTYLVPTHADLDGGSIDHIETERHASGFERAWIDFTPAGAEQFHELTARAVGTKLAVLADGAVVAAPVIMAAIEGGRAEVTLRAKR